MRVAPKMSKREDRLKRLEQEREYFYRQKQIQSSNLNSSSGASLNEGQNTRAAVPDFNAIKQRLGINPSTGKQFFSVDNVATTGLSESNPHRSSSNEKLASQAMVDDILSSSPTRSITQDPVWNVYNVNGDQRPTYKPQKTRVDAFEKIMSKDQKTRQKYHASDKSLLEDERARNAVLEDSYAQLLRQVQQLQNTHLLDLRNSESRFHAASAALQKALVNKSEELVSFSNRLTSSEARYERDSREWQKERVSLKAQLETLATSNADLLQKVDDREKRLHEMNKLRKELAERIAIREQDLIKYGKALRERESDFAKEKETRIKLEQQVANFQEHQLERDNQFRDLQTQLHKKVLETEELAGLKIVLSEAKRDLEDLNRREKFYNTEIEQMAGRERKLFSQVEQLTITERKYSHEITKLSEKQSTLIKDLEERQVREERMAKDLYDAQSKTLQQEGDVQKYERQLKQNQLETARMLQEFTNLQATAQDSQLSNQSLTKELLISKNNEEVLEKDREAALSKVASLSKDLGSKTREVDVLRSEITQLNERIAHEREQQQELRQQSKEKFGQVTSKITELQDTLVETQTQLAELRANEKNVRATLKQKEDVLKSQSQAFSDAEAKIQELLTSSSKEAIEFEQFKNKKRDEFLALQDKYSQAKQLMDSEVGQIRHQLVQKQNQYNGLAEEFNELKADLADANSFKLQLEGRISELTANDSSLQRQVATLTTNLNQKTQELSRLTSKHNSLVEQTKRLDEELNLYRENNTTARDADISRLQTNMEEISKRLKSQVDVLLEKEPTDASTTQHTRSLSSSTTSALRSPSRYALGSNAHAAPRINSTLTESPFQEDFDNLEKLLNRSATLK